MEPERSVDVVSTEERKDHPNNTATLVKYLAMLIFIAVPFIGGWIGYQYGTQQKVLVIEERPLAQPKQTDTETKPPTTFFPNNLPNTYQNFIYSLESNDTAECASVGCTLYHEFAYQDQHSDAMINGVILKGVSQPELQKQRAKGATYTPVSLSTDYAGSAFSVEREAMLFFTIDGYTVGLNCAYADCESELTAFARFLITQEVTAPRNDRSDLGRPQTKQPQPDNHLISADGAKDDPCQKLSAGICYQTPNCQATYTSTNCHDSDCADSRTYTGCQTLSEGSQTAATEHFDQAPQLSTSYIHLHDTPYYLADKQGTFTCPVGDGDIGLGLPSTTKEGKLGSYDTCVTFVNEGTAGSSYNTYTYTTKVNDTIHKIWFTLRYINCGGYATDEKMSECQLERDNFNVDDYAQSLMAHVLAN